MNEARRGFGLRDVFARAEEWAYYRPMNTKELAGTAMLSALAAVMEILPLDLRYPLPGRVSIDPVGIPIAVAAILYGPRAGVLAVGITGVAITARGNPIGAIFKMPAELSTAIPLAVVLLAFKDRISREPRTVWSAVGLSWCVAVTTRAVVMTPVIYFLFQLLFSYTPAETLPLLFPFQLFNILQGVINVIPAYLIVDRLPPDLKPAWLTQP